MVSIIPALLRLRGGGSNDEEDMEIRRTERPCNIQKLIDRHGIKTPMPCGGLRITQNCEPPDNLIFVMHCVFAETNPTEDLLRVRAKVTHCRQALEQWGPVGYNVIVDRTPTAILTYWRRHYENQQTKLHSFCRFCC